MTTVAQTHVAFLLPIARNFRNLGWRIDAAAAGINDAPECRREYDQVFEMCWSRNPLDLRRHITSARRVYSIVEAGSYDIVHVHTPVAAFITRFALRRLRRRGLPKIVYTAHGFHFHPLAQPIKRAIFKLLERIAAGWTDRLVVINQHDKMAAEKFLVALNNKIVYMPGIGIDRAEYCPERITGNDILKMKADIGLSSGTPLFVMVAEFISRKRHIDLIDALMGIDRQVHVAFAGEGKLLDSMKAYVKGKELGDRVHFLGHRDDIPLLMRSSVATVLPSIQEGLSRSVMESLCLGIPVIGSDIRGIRDLLEDGGGLLVQPRSPNALKEAIEWILDHPEKARAMGNKGRQNSAKYDLPNLLHLHEVLYKELLKS